MPSYDELGEKHKELLERSREVKDAMVERISTGKLLEKHLCDDGQYLYVFQTGDNMYGYAVCRNDGEQPYYFAESPCLLTDLDKKTDSNGVTLRYDGPKSMVQRNLIGIFSEYINDRGFEGFYISAKAPKDAEYNITDGNTTMDVQDCTSLFTAQFDNNHLYFASGVRMGHDANGKQSIMIENYNLDKRGNVNFDDRIDRMVENAFRNRMSGFPFQDREAIEKEIQQRHEACASILYPMYTELGLPIPEGVEYNPLLEDIFAGRQINNEELKALMSGQEEHKSLS